MARARVNATPWNNGVNQATVWKNGGSCSIGKKVPLNRKSGVMMKRKMIANDCSFWRVAVHAAMGMAKATPVRIAAGQAKIAVGEVIAPKKNDTIRNTPVTMPMRTISQ